MDEIVAAYKWTADELITAQRWYIRQSIGRYVVYLIWGLIVFLVGIGTFNLLVLRHSSGAIALAIGLFLLFLHKALEPWRLRRAFQRRPDNGIEIQWHITPEKISSRTAFSNSDSTWDLYAKVVQTPDGFLIYPNNQIFTWIPRHALADNDAFERLSQLASRHAKQFIQIAK